MEAQAWQFAHSVGDIVGNAPQVVELVCSTVDRLQMPFLYCRLFLVIHPVGLSRPTGRTWLHP
jgi:hypothetical protein